MKNRNEIDLSNVSPAHAARVLQKWNASRQGKTSVPSIHTRPGSFVTKMSIELVPAITAIAATPDTQPTKPSTLETISNHEQLIDSATADSMTMETTDPEELFAQAKANVVGLHKTTDCFSKQFGDGRTVVVAFIEGLTSPKKRDVYEIYPDGSVKLQKSGGAKTLPLAKLQDPETRWKPATLNEFDALMNYITLLELGDDYAAQTLRRAA